MKQLTEDAAPCPNLCYCERGANRAEIARLQEAKRMAGLIADERSRENAALRAAFRVNTLRWQPGLSHAEIDAEIERIVRGDVATKSEDKHADT